MRMLDTTGGRRAIKGLGIQPDWRDTMDFAARITTDAGTIFCYSFREYRYTQIRLQSEGRRLIKVVTFADGIHLDHGASWPTY